MWAKNSDKIMSHRKNGIELDTIQQNRFYTIPRARGHFTRRTNATTKKNVFYLM